MKKILTLLLLVLYGQLFANPIQFSNSKLKVVYDQKKLSFYNVNSTNPFMKDILLDIKDVKKADIKKVTHSVFGKGSELAIVDEQETTVKISLFETLPFVMIQKTLKNATDKELRIAKLSVFEGLVDLGVGASELKTNSTAGLRVANKPSGSYMFMAVGNPKNNEGVVCAWLTTSRGSGIVFSESANNQVVIKARIDYGDLRVPAGKTADSEILVIGYDRDVRAQLEAYADAIAKNMNIKLLPQPTIYCTWYHGGASNEKKIAENTDFASAKLKNYGLNVMQIDDGWQFGKRGDGPIRGFWDVNPTGPYRSGMKYTADYIKSKGMIPGIWFIPFAGSWYDDYWKDKMDLFLKAGPASDNNFDNSHPDSKLFTDKNNKPYVARWGGTCLDLSNPKALDYVADISSRISKEWGYKYFKMDGLWTGSGTRCQYTNSEYKDDDLGTQIRFNPALSPIEAYIKGFETIRKSAGNDVFLLGCCAPQNMRSFGAAMGRVDAMRVGADNGANLWGLSTGARFASRVYFLNKRVWYNDPDPGYVRAELPLEMTHTFMSWISLTGSLHGSSEQYSELSDERLDVLRKSMPSHDLKTVRPIDFLDNDVPSMWHLTDRRDAVQKDVIGLFNFDRDKAVNITCALSRVDLPKSARYVGFDFWANRFIPPFSESISAYLIVASCRIISIRPERNYPQVVSTSRHLTQGIVDLTNEKWNSGSMTLSGTSLVMGNDEYEIRVVVPTGIKGYVVDKVITTSPGITTSFVQDGSCIRAKIKAQKDQKVDWTIRFKHGELKESPMEKPTITAAVDLDRIVVKWNKSTKYQYRLIKNGVVLGELSTETFVDPLVTLGATYKYGIQAKDWTGNWSEISEVTISMLTSYPTPPVPPKPIVNCSDLNVAGGNVKKNLSYSGQPISLNGVVQPNGIGTSFNSGVKYNIPADSKKFVSTVFMESGEGLNPNYKCVFAVYGDVMEMGEPPVELTRSPGLKAGEKWHFDVDLNPRYKQIKLVSRPAGTSGAKANVVWVNAGFIK